MNGKQYSLAPRTFEGGAVSPLPILHFRNRAISQNDKNQRGKEGEARESLLMARTVLHFHYLVCNLQSFHELAPTDSQYRPNIKNTHTQD